MHQPLVIDGLTKRYGALTALHNMSFRVEPGEIFGFVGSNGAGKSTTMRIVLGMQSADAGKVYLGEQRMDLDLRRTVGYMPEERGLYPKMKVAAQLRYLAKLHGLSNKAAHANVDAWLERLGLSTRANDNLGDLSLGNQQRAQLAAALVHDPSVLVLDEPFSGLDPVAVDVMSDVLEEKAAQGVPVIFSSHQLDLVQRLCHRVGIIAAGQMRALGTVDELRAHGPVTLEVVGPEEHTRWADGLPGVRECVYQGTTTLLTIDNGTDDQALLTHALASGPVHRFTTCKPDLTELFREVVAS